MFTPLPSWERVVRKWAWSLGLQTLGTTPQGPVLSGPEVFHLTGSPLGMTLTVRSQALSHLGNVSSSAFSLKMLRGNGGWDTAPAAHLVFGWIFLACWGGKWVSFKDHPRRSHAKVRWRSLLHSNEKPMLCSGEQANNATNRKKHPASGGHKYLLCLTVYLLFNDQAKQTF